MNTFFMQSYDATLDGLKQHLFWRKSSPGGPSDFCGSSLFSVELAFRSAGFLT
jgi:hypothetical protein